MRRDRVIAEARDCVQRLVAAIEAGELEADLPDRQSLATVLSVLRDLEGGTVR